MIETTYDNMCMRTQIELMRIIADNPAVVITHFNLHNEEHKFLLQQVLFLTSYSEKDLWINTNYYNWIRFWFVYHKQKKIKRVNTHKPLPPKCAFVNIEQLHKTMSMVHDTLEAEQPWTMADIYRAYYKKRRDNK